MNANNHTHAEVNKVYSFVNKFNNVFIVKVTRVTDKSVFVASLADDGTYFSEHRESFKSFEKYTLQK